ncbi:glucose-1-phosphate cytidylyltransferase [Thermodesulfovibrionales bacterium]|nr:glucose-1-phosphate cytidylyltransferase [Thermodesulfovibrionales bacterium]
MKVVILCGGLGTRLREETEFRPKPMVEIGGKPILWHIMKIYAHYRFNDFILCLGYKGEMIKEYFYNYEVLNNDFTIELGGNKDVEIHSNHTEKGWRITLVDTGDKALKGARLKRIEKYIDGNQFMVTYGDGVADININDLLKFHQSHGKMATLSGVRPLSRFGELSVKGRQVLQFSEKSQSSKGLINGGFFVFNRQIFDYLEDKDDCDLEYGVLEKLALEEQLMVYKHTKFWYCMDTVRDMDYLNKLCLQGKIPWKAWESQK